MSYIYAVTWSHETEQEASQEWYPTLREGRAAFREKVKSEEAEAALGRESGPPTMSYIYADDFEAFSPAAGLELRRFKTPDGVSARKLYGFIHQHFGLGMVIGGEVLAEWEVPPCRTGRTTGRVIEHSPKTQEVTP